MELIKNILIRHENDLEQTNFLKTSKNRVILKAPAGYGKTKVLISKIELTILKNELKSNKKILALTYSVNAAKKMREEIKLNLCNDYIKKIEVSNYHGICSRILNLYGRYIDESLSNFSTLQRINESNLSINNCSLSKEEIELLKNMNNYISNFDEIEYKNNKKKYINILLKLIKTDSMITFNGIIFLTIKLLDIDSIKHFYTNYYKVIFIDEFQDTNILSYELLQKLIGENTALYLIGDPIQKIYGFLGAIPSIFDICKNEYNMECVELKTNYRFSSNKNLLDLEKFIRYYFYNYSDSNNIVANLYHKRFISEKEEIETIINRINNLDGINNKVAILTRSQYNNDFILEYMDNNNIDYFYGFISEDEDIYKEFHQTCYRIYQDSIKNKISINKKLLDKIYQDIISHYENVELGNKDKKVINSLNLLLNTFFESFNDSSNIRTSKERHDIIEDIFINNNLKLYMDKINKNITITTVHSSKGLEWDYVYLPNLYSFSFPTSKALCSLCNEMKSNNKTQKNCEFKFDENLREKFLDELSVFYVAITRSKKEVYVSTNDTKNRYGYYKQNSCFLNLTNLNLLEWT